VGLHGWEQRSSADFLLTHRIDPVPAAGVVDAIAEYGFEWLHFGTAEHVDEISWRAHTFSSPDADAHGEIGIFITLLCGAVLGVTTLGSIVVDAHIDKVAAPQMCLVVGDEGVEAVVQMTDDGEAEMLTHAWSPKTKRCHRVEESGRIVPIHE
jgi:hypothetical protein